MFYDIKHSRSDYKNDIRETKGRQNKINKKLGMPLQRLQQLNQQGKQG